MIPIGNLVYKNSFYKTILLVKAVFVKNAFIKLSLINFELLLIGVSTDAKFLYCYHWFLETLVFFNSLSSKKRRQYRLR